MTTKSDRETEIKQIENGYSYFRLSSKKQLGKDRAGLDRQMARPQEICNAHGWQLQRESFADLGVSSFRDKNRMRGSLAEFIKLATQGKLKPHPVLILEAWDRYSRGTIDEAFESVRELLKSGLAFHIAYGDRTFVKADLESASSRNEITQALEAAHNYSKQLSDRVARAKELKLARLENGESVNLRDYAPRWISWNKEARKMVLNDRAEAVRMIFNGYQSGKSLTGVCRLLVDRKIKSFLGGNWTKQTVRNILSNPATYGEFKGKQDVFPAVVSKDQFDSVQLELSRNTGVKLEKKPTLEGWNNKPTAEKWDEKKFGTFEQALAAWKKVYGDFKTFEEALADWQKTRDTKTAFGRRGRNSKGIVNIFRGLVRCSCCGGAMSMSSGRAHKYFRCDAAVTHECDNRLSARMDLVEFAVIGDLAGMSPEDLLAAHDKSLSRNIAQLTVKREELTKKINALIELAGIIGTDEIKSKMLPLKTERDQVDSEISKLQTQASMASKSPEAFSTFQKLMAGALGIPGVDDKLTKDETHNMAIAQLDQQLKNEAMRKQLANIMPNIIKTIRINGNSELEATFVQGGTQSCAI